MSLNCQRSENPDHFTGVGSVEYQDGWGAVHVYHELYAKDDEDDFVLLMSKMLKMMTMEMMTMMMMKTMWVKLAGGLSGASLAPDRGCTHHLLSPLAHALPLALALELALALSLALACINTFSLCSSSCSSTTSTSDKY